MDSAPTATLLDDIIEFILSRPTLEEIVAYRIPEELDERLHILLDRNSQDELLLEERAELDEFLRIGHMLRLLKAKARLKLTEQP
jgi:hypothetical protein